MPIGIKGKDFSGKNLYSKFCFYIIVLEGDVVLRKEDDITKEYLENILESMEGGVLTINRNGRITSFNLSAEETTGFRREEALNRECCDILKSDLCNESCPLKEAMETGKPVFSYEINITTKAGNKVPVNITTSPLLSSDNEIIGAAKTSGI